MLSSKRGIILLLAVFVIICSSGSSSIAHTTSSFGDVTRHWAYPQIRYMMNQEMINGYGDGTFRPEQRVTRAEFITILNQAFKLNAMAPVNFSDVQREDWYYKELSRAVAAAYLPHYDGWKINPNQTIPREEAAYMMAKLLKLETSNWGAAFFWDESSISEPYGPAIRAMSEARYMIGYPDGSFRPLNPISRAEAVGIVCNGLEVKFSQETGYNVRDFGAKGNGSADDTAAIQKTVDYIAYRGGGTVYIPSGIYLIDPARAIELIDNVILNLDDNAVLKAMATRQANYEIIRIRDANNVEVSGGSIIGDRKIHTGTGGEWGHGISIIGSNNIKIRNVSISDCWGDGIYIGSTSQQNYCQKISIDKFHIDYCRRNGITIISGKNITIANGMISNTRGTNPQAGLCLEPNDTAEIMQNVVIKNLQTLNNGGYGILFGFGRYANSRNEISITINNFTDTNSAKGGMSSYSGYQRPAYRLQITVGNKQMD